MTTFPISVQRAGDAATPVTAATNPTAEDEQRRRKREERAQLRRWFFGQATTDNPALVMRRLPVTLPATKDIREHPLYGGVLARIFWRIANYRLTRSGRWFLLLTLPLGMFGAVSLDIQIYIPFLYVMAAWAIALGALPLIKPRLKLRARHAGRVAAGERLPVDIDITQSKSLPAFDLNLMAHRLPLDIDATEETGVPVGNLARGETVRIRTELICRRRGVYRLPGWRVETDFPLGIVNAYRPYYENTQVVVYPRYHPLRRLDVPTGRRYQPGGVALATKVGESFEYFGNREFREGDNIRDIDWRATARMAGTPILREWRQEYFLRIAVILDTFIPKPSNPLLAIMPTLAPTLSPAGARARAQYEQRLADFENAVSLAAAVSDFMAGQEYIVDLFAAGPTLYHLMSGRGLATNDQVLDILSNVQGSSADDLADVLPQMQEDLPRLTSVVCIFLDWNEERRAFVEQLRQHGVGVKTVVVRTGAPTVDPSEDRRSGGDVAVVDAPAFAAGVEEL